MLINLKQKLAEGEAKTVTLGQHFSSENRIQTRWDELPSEEKARKKAYYDDLRAEKAKAVEKAAKKALKPKVYKPRDCSWKIIAGVTLPAEKLGCYVRCADLDKKAKIGFSNANTFLSPYIDPNILKKVGKKQYVRTAFLFMMFDVDSNFAADQWTKLFPDLAFSYITGREIAPGLYERPHITIGLKYPVFINPQSHQPVDIQKRQRMDKVRFDAIEDHIVQKLKAVGVKIDKGQKTCTKNPDSNHWDSNIGFEGSRTLTEIEYSLGIKGKKFQSTGNRKSVVIKSPRNLQLPKPISGIRVHANTPTAPMSLPKAETLRGRTEAVIEKVNSFGFKGTKAQEDCVYEYHSRNETIFNEIRFIAYKFRMQNKDATSDDVYDYIEPYAHELNSVFPQPLDHKEIKSTLNSIAKYCTRSDFRDMDLRNRGAAGDIILVFEERRVKQQKGALYTNYIVSIKNWKKVMDFRKDFPIASKSEVSIALKISRTTVMKYWNIKDPSEIYACARYLELKKEVSSIKSALYGSTQSAMVPENNSVQCGVLREIGHTKEKSDCWRMGGGEGYSNKTAEDMDGIYDDESSEYEYFNHYLAFKEREYFEWGPNVYQRNPNCEDFDGESIFGKSEIDQIFEDMVHIERIAAEQTVEFSKVKLPMDTQKRRCSAI